MKTFATLAAFAVLSAASSSAHATPITSIVSNTTNTATNTTSSTVSNTTSNTTNTASTVAATFPAGINLGLSNGTTNDVFTLVSPGVFNATDTFHNVTVTYANASSLLDTFTVTDICATLNSSPCTAETLTISDNKAAGISLGLGLSAAAQAATTLQTNVATLNLNGSLGASAETLNFALPAASNSPVPEPGSLSLLASGVLSAAGILRRRFRA